MGAQEEKGPEIKVQQASMEDEPRNPFRFGKFSIWKRLGFFDVDALIRAGYKKAATLHNENMYDEPTVKTEVLVNNLQPGWEHQQFLYESGQKIKPDLKLALLKGNVQGLVFTGILYLVSQACSLAGPLLLREIVTSLQCHAIADKLPPPAAAQLGCDPLSKAYYYLIGLFLAPFIQSICENHQTYLLYLIGTRMRNALMATIYRKCLRLSNSALQSESTGRVVTLMSNDAQKLQDAMMAIHAMWGSPVYIIAVLILLWFQVGWAMFVGLGVMLLLVPITGKLAAKLGGLRREIMKWTDQRVGYMSELLNGIQMIKFYAWEPSFQERVMACRNKEARILRISAVWQGLFAMLVFAGPVAVAVFCFGSYTIAGNELTSARAYTALSLFALLRFPMSFLPMLITMVINALVALKRISGFLQRPESTLAQWDEKVVSRGEVLITDGVFAWDEPDAQTDPFASAKGGPGGAAGGPGGKGKGPAAGGPAKGGPAQGGPAKGGPGGPGGPPGGPRRGPTKAEKKAKRAKARADMEARARAWAAKNGGAAPAAAVDANGAAAANGHHGTANGHATAAAIAEAASTPEKTPPATLQGIELSAKPGTLTMVVGSVGSGKSSVLSALLGTISSVSGRVCVGGSVAYVAQSAWIMNDTVQENVLMGAELDPDRYKMALDVSCLGPDLEILPNGDLTEIGDRGVTLSGGQKQRVSIARAVYADADVYLLDDPLSAVDSHVGRDLFERCIRGALHSKTVVLVTNALQYLPHADHIVWMDSGRIRAQGTYNQLVEAGLNIAELAHMDGSSEEENDDEDAADGTADGAAVRVSKSGKVEPQGKDQQTDLSRVGSRSAAKKKPIDHRQQSMSKAAEAKVTLVRQETGANKNLTGIETRESGAISFSVIRTYLGHGGGLPVLALLLVLFGLEQACRVWTDKWVGIWFSPDATKDNWYYLGAYFGLGIAYGFATFIRSITFMFMCVFAAVGTHNELLNHVLLLPKMFFDTNPAGRVLNRFSRDTDIMDATLPGSLIQFAGCVATYVSIMVVIAVSTKWFAVALGPLTIIYFLIQRFYIDTARELQRIESVSRSPIYSKFSEALAGVATIRAYRKEAHFTTVSDVLMEENARAFVTQKLAAGWLAMRLDMLGLTVLVLCGALVIQGGIDPATAGLALVYALDLTRFLKHGTNMASKSEADFNSVERICQYLTPETEAPPETDPEVLERMPKDWPEHGALALNKVTMRYRPDMPLVLKGVTFEVAAGDKVGLVGRTGSGKSSLFLVLFRMVELESGTITIDGIDTRTLGLRHLRSVMSIIPQDPFMFSGTVRKNLDPFGKADDTQLWEALEAVGLKAAIQALDAKLDAQVVDNGSNFSLGQRQLICLARAMLRRSRLLMLDEATASVDLDTDAALQTAIRLRFADCTMLTIAHRLNTIMDSDKVVVMDQGVVAEVDEPDNLLQKMEGIFTGMVEQTGRASSRYLRSLARSAKETRSARIAAGGNANGSPRGYLPALLAQLTGNDDDGASGSGSSGGGSSPRRGIGSGGVPRSPVAHTANAAPPHFFGPALVSKIHPGSCLGAVNSITGSNGAGGTVRVKSLLGTRASIAAAAAAEASSLPSASSLLGSAASRTRPLAVSFSKLPEVKEGKEDGPTSGGIGAGTGLLPAISSEGAEATQAPAAAAPGAAAVSGGGEDHVASGSTHATSDGTVDAVVYADDAVAPAAVDVVEEGEEGSNSGSSSSGSNASSEAAAIAPEDVQVEEAASSQPPGANGRSSPTA